MSIKHGRDYKNEPSQKNLYPVLGTGGEITKIDTFLCNWSCACIGRKGTINKPIYMDSPFWCIDTLFYSQPFYGENSQFQYYLFETINWLLYNEASGVPSLSASTIENIRVNVPNINEQIKLVQFFSLIDHKINKQRELIDHLKSYKRGLLSRLFPKKGKTVPEHRFRSFTNDWEQRKLVDAKVLFTDGNYGEAYPKASDMTDSSSGIPFLTGGNLKDGKLDITGASYITLEKHSKLTSGHLAEDDIVIAVRGSLGALAYVNADNSGWNINSQLAILRTDKSELIGKYLIQFLMSWTGQKELLKKQTGSALKQLPINAIKDVKIPITFVDEQKKIGKFFENLDTLITLHQEKWELYVNIKSALLQKMFT